MSGQLNWMIHLVLAMVYFGDPALAMSVFLGMNLCDSIQGDELVTDFVRTSRGLRLFASYISSRSRCLRICLANRALHGFRNVK